MRTKMIIRLMLAGCILFASQAAVRGSASDKRIEAPVRESIDTRQATQEAEEKWRREKEKLAARYEQLQDEQARLQGRKAELQPQVETARARVAAKEKQLADIEQISTQIRPFLDALVGDLQLLTETGLPFLTAERCQRIEKLKGLMPDPEIAISEKYRKVMEALLIEAEYGFTIEVYQETIAVEGQNLLADIFRLGRLSLFYQSIDRKHCGFYNVVARAWQTLPASQNWAIQTAVDIAAKRRPVELLALPLGRLVQR